MEDSQASPAASPYDDDRRHSIVWPVSKSHLTDDNYVDDPSQQQQRGRGCSRCCCNPKCGNGNGAISIATGAISLVSAVAAILFTIKAVLYSLSPTDHGGKVTIEAFTLSMLCSVTFLVGANSLMLFDITSKAGAILLHRSTPAKIIDNWEKETLRSFVELSIWLGTSWWTLQLTGSGMTALACGTATGWIVVFCGEFLTGTLRTLERRIRRACGEDEDECTSLASGSVTLCCLYGYGGLSTIFQHSDDILTACCLAGLAGLLLLTSAKLITAWPPTRRCGEMLQDRVLNAYDNWGSCPTRSATERGDHCIEHPSVTCVCAPSWQGIAWWYDW